MICRAFTTVPPREIDASPRGCYDLATRRPGRLGRRVATWWSDPDIASANVGMSRPTGV